MQAGDKEDLLHATTPHVEQEPVEGHNVNDRRAPTLVLLVLERLLSLEAARNSAVIT